MHHGIVQGPFFVAAHNRTPTAAPLNGTTVPYLPKNSPPKNTTELQFAIRRFQGKVTHKISK